MNQPLSFIVIDDDLINNMLCRILIKASFKESAVQTFDFPENGFEYIAREYATENDEPAVLFLDINMPTWSGWDFLDNFEKLDETIKKQIRIYMLSSAIDPKDKERALENKYVVDYIKKP